MYIIKYMDERIDKKYFVIDTDNFNLTVLFISALAADMATIQPSKASSELCP